MSAYPRIRVSMFSTAYPRIRVSTSQYSLKFTWGGVVLSTAYPRIQPFQRCSFKMAGYSAVKPKKDLVDFSQPWELSDVVLVVEESRFHVHRCILAIWSTVFSRMFQSEFKERATNKIPLPGKKADEVKELLLVIYPTSSKSIDERNYPFLLDLAREYMMAKVTKKCEDFLLSNVRTYALSLGLDDDDDTFPDCLDLLAIAQEYELEALQSACVEEAQKFSLREFKRHKTYDKINFSTYRKIVEGKIDKLERALQGKRKCR